MRANALAAGALPERRWESLQRFPEPLAGFGGEGMGLGMKA